MPWNYYTIYSNLNFFIGHEYSFISWHLLPTTYYMFIHMASHAHMHCMCTSPNMHINCVRTYTYIKSSQLDLSRGSSIQSQSDNENTYENPNSQSGKCAV